MTATSSSLSSIGMQTPAGMSASTGLASVGGVYVRRDLADLCEPLFSYICLLNRSARAGGPTLEVSAVRGEIDSMLKAIAERTAGDPEASQQFQKVRQPLIFFIDHMIMNSGLPFAGQWPSLAHEEQEYAGDDKFFDLLDLTLADNSPAAGERLAVFYTCVAMGFTGKYRDEPDVLKMYLNRAAARIGDRMDGDESRPICPKAYKYTDKRILQPPVAGRLVGTGIAVAALLLLALVLNIVMYRLGTDDVRKGVRELNTAADRVDPPVQPSR